MMSLTLEYIVWMIFSKYNFQKTIPYFLSLKHNFENS